ncbi:G patch domain-containing protein 4 [Dermochelys coriacea]|uniref:G patch domain-containing protein 4 n=1 Tax=Dermochelys coriacea TaxID=27794 RepID=UPI0018E7F664|nr:G patch domain-containing protein 4 [Dermochelys coriacea]
MNSSPKNKSRGMKFAEQQLQRHGWKQGKGLGKRENGISEAIKVKVKCDTAGVGHDPAEQFTFHWWDHLFNKSAANISVEAGQDGVQMKKLSEQDGEISNKKPRKAPSARSMLYGRFVKAATLTAGGEEPTKQVATSESSEDEEEKLDLSSARKLTDEELVRACGGRTAHKGARHGLTMSAKLARLEEQERAFLAKYSQEERSGDAPQRQQEAVAGASALESSNLAERRQKAKKKKRKRSKEEGGCAEAHGRPEPGEEEEEGRRARKKKKKEKEVAEGLENKLPDSREQLMVTERAKKKKKKKKGKDLTLRMP